jgi:hypothetical protein
LISTWWVSDSSLTWTGPMVALWVGGPARLAECCDRAVAVVGSRAATSYGTQIAGDLGAGLGQRGHTVVGAASGPGVTVWLGSVVDSVARTVARLIVSAPRLGARAE